MRERSPGHRGAVCPWWLCFTFDNSLRRWVHPPQAVLGGLLLPGQTALDLGCGMGYFSLPMARLVGQAGKVIAADLQPEMLAGVGRRATRAGLAERIVLHRCRTDSLGLDRPVDFVLAFWMLHEVPDRERLLREVGALLEPQGRFLLVEPILHVSRAAFRNTLEAAWRVGWAPVESRSVRISQAVLLRRAAEAGEGSR